MPLPEQELRTLSIVSDTIIPRIQTQKASSSAFYERSATDLGVDKALADIIETKLEPSLREQFRRLLRILDNRAYNLILGGLPVKFSDLNFEERTKYLAKWRDSGLASKRQAFQALKRLVCFLFYTLTDANGGNPNWAEIGYPGPKEKSPISHPENLKITSIHIENDLTLDCDACIIGSGAGGSVIAHELSKAGFKVVVAESGSYLTSETFDQGELSMMNKLFDEYGTAATKDLSFVLLSGRGAGGGTTVNWMTSIKPPREVLAEWESAHGIRGLTGEEFQGYVDEIWHTLKVNLNESQRNPNNDILWKGCESLGYKKGVDYEQIWRNAVGCKERCAFCTYGCVYSCKQSTLINYLPMAFKNGAKFLFNTKIEHIIVEGGAAKGVEGKFVNPSAGKTSHVKINAKAVVVACGAIKTPALLLNSGLKEKNIGKNLRLHPTTAVSGHFNEEIRAWDGPPQTAVVTKFLRSDGGTHGFWMEAAPSHPGLFALSTPWPDGKGHKEYMKERFNRSSANIVLLKEWGGGNVTIDKHGSAVVSYKLDDRDRKNMVQGIKETAKILVAAGASGLSTLHSDPLEVSSTAGNPLTQSELDAFSDQVEKRGIAPNKIMLFSAHLMGSCAMTSDQSLGATDPNGELYGVRNLFVGDASVFPTTLGVNPMITIMSMAKRTARFIAGKLPS
jgi:choline dehydrogenase-like flavoprotein